MIIAMKIMLPKTAPTIAAGGTVRPRSSLGSSLLESVGENGSTGEARVVELGLLDSEIVAVGGSEEGRMLVAGSVADGAGIPDLIELVDPHVAALDPSRV